jgi:BirA family biotin operon repressor/biotin-[acetyl-CoA-carboxylase] ligase
VGLKWPNDLVIEGGKTGGILTEIGVTGDRLDYAIVGIGLNVNLEPGQLRGELLVPATSLAHALGRPVERLPLLWAILRAIEVRYRALGMGHSPRDEWAERLVTLGRPVRVSGGGVELEGVAEAVDRDGALLLRTTDGRLETVIAGDVTLRSEGPTAHA